MRLCPPRSWNPFFVVALFLASAGAYAASGDPWEKAGSGQHSFRTLGEDFYVEVPVRRPEGARVLLFNHALAKRIGLDVAGSQTDLEKKILEAFAWVVAKPGEKSEKTFIATRYQDSGDKLPGAALGDGRALWFGEVEVPLEDGRVLYLDFTGKGVGQTPLAWLNHSDPLHKDGLQSAEEAVHSFAMSEVNLRNQLDSVGDLAVIELPFLKLDKHSGATAKAALTIRVGNQTRIAHYRYFADNKRRFAKIFEYAVARDLGLRPGAALKGTDVQKYLDDFTKNLAEEAARYYDLHAAHASPTPGNRTTKGSTIDLGTFRYLDAHHKNYSYLFDRLKLGGQTEQLEGYLAKIFEYAKQASYPMPSTYAVMKTKFYAFFKASLTEQWLHRMGLDAASIARLPRPLKDKFYRVVKDFSEQAGNAKVNLGGDRVDYAAAFETREVLRKAIAWKLDGEVKRSGGVFSWLTGSKKVRDWAPIFRSGREWAKPSEKATLIHSKAFGQVVDEIFAALSPSAGEAKEWTVQAEMVGAQTRLPNGRTFYEKFEKPSLEAIRSRKPMLKVREPVWAGVDALTDLGIAKHPNAHLNHAKRIAVFSGTFDPPHMGHIEFVKRVKAAYQIDVVYVIPNLTAEHKSGVTDYLLRREMTRSTFQGLAGAVVADESLEEAFRRGDMEEVLHTVHGQNPTADLYLIMGDDSFERFARIGDTNPLVSGVIVNPRKSGAIIPAAIGDIPVLDAGRARIFTTSSTEVRAKIAEGNLEATRGYLSTGTIEIIQKNQLYGKPPSKACPPWMGLDPGFAH